MYAEKGETVIAAMDRISVPVSYEFPFEADRTRPDEEEEFDHELYGDADEAAVADNLHAPEGMSLREVSFGVIPARE